MNERLTDDELEKMDLEPHTITTRQVILAIKELIERRANDHTNTMRPGTEETLLPLDREGARRT